MSTDLLVIVDDGSGAFSYPRSNTTLWIPWGGATDSYNETFHHPFDADQQSYGSSFTFTFNGRSAAFIGYTSPPAAPQTATVQIDNGTSFGIVHESSSTYKQWFITPTLPDGDHTITISSLYNTSIDYAVIKVGSQTPLTGQTVIVDDESPFIQYSGQWSRNANRFNSYPGSWIGYPYCNGTHRSSNPGDTLTFRFSGTSIAVYGFISWHNLGRLSATYSVDGIQFPSSISVNTSSDTYSAGFRELSNQLYFSRDGLVPGPHTLLVNVTEANNQVFVLDYLTYKPAFDTLSSMPFLSLGVSSPSSSTGTIVGGVLGGLVFGVFLILVTFFVLRQRRARRQASAYPDAALSSGTNDPNILSYPHTFSPFQMQRQPIIGAISTQYKLTPSQPWN